MSTDVSDQAVAGDAVAVETAGQENFNQVHARFTTAARLKGICSSDSWRMLDNAMLMPERQYGSEVVDSVVLAATNGRALGVVRAYGHADGCYLIPPQAIKAVTGKCQYHCVLNGRWEIASGNKITVADAIEEQSESRCSLPDLPSVMPDVRENSGYDAVCLDVNLLVALANMVSVEGQSSRPITLLVKRRFNEGEGGKAKSDGYAIPVVGNAGVGVIMPMNCDRANAIEVYRDRRHVLEVSWNRDAFKARYEVPEKKED